MHCRSAEGEGGASRSMPKAGKDVHQSGLMGLTEREDAAVEVSSPVHDEGAIEFRVIACLLRRPAR